ncbi:PREDICTED: heat stress transcription factor B-3 [Tarenaya hassleriana]|uniref:heat stress transcription factor B-3 n=1 Tax=Tarenaya hassleriana TaxID=28532 RepID=UPI00053C268E|nr:PREDICTED: heat stress transcription factor B-3 [Tarenaya hassleriana]
MEQSAVPAEEEEEGEEEWMVRRSEQSPPPFLVKTYAVVEDPETDDVISWNDDGTSFVVWQPPEFSRDLLPKLFKHCNFSSFVRQLNTYGFRKVSAGRWEFWNKMFRKGQRELLCNIRRKKAHPHHACDPTTSTPPRRDDQRSSSSASSLSSYSNLLDENKRLRKEHGFLTTELAMTKMKCKELLELTERYKTTPEEEEEEEDGLKLFGVKLE